MELRAHLALRGGADCIGRHLFLLRSVPDQALGAVTDPRGLLYKPLDYLDATCARSGAGCQISLSDGVAWSLEWEVTHILLFCSKLTCNFCISGL